MATVLDEMSRTFAEFLLLPNLTRKDCVPGNVSLKSPMVRHQTGTPAALNLNIPFVSSIMQAVSNDAMAIALARSGGVSFIYGSQAIQEQAEMVRKVKKFKAGFVVSDSNVPPHATLSNVLEIRDRTGHTTMAVTDTGDPAGKLLGIITSRDYRVDKTDHKTPVSELMTPFKDLVYGREGITLKEANQMIWQHRLSCLPVIDDSQTLRHLVFRKDYDEHKEHPTELIDAEKRLVVGAGINTRDYRERIPALIDAGADVLCIDSSDGFNEWQADCLAFAKQEYPRDVLVGAGNVVDPEGFTYLADAGADFVKVGVGPASICITREQKGIGRGQASAILDVAAARDAYTDKTGQYVPICSDGGIVLDYHIVLALAMGADFVMMGRYFARFDESPARRIRVGSNFVKEYWGEGTNRAKNWARYDSEGRFAFEEGVDAYVPYAGKLKDNLDLTLDKVRATMCNCGATDLAQLRAKSRLTVISATSLREGSSHDVIMKEADYAPQL